ncbi:MAG: hypothetical protein QXE90_02650 [Candidatus Micrarchaeia archaeon]
MDEEIISLADKVISILKQRKIVELADLIKETGAQEHDIKLIINLLEKEEMVDVGYSLTKVLVSWNDEADRILMKMKKNQKIVSLNSHEASKISRSRNGNSLYTKHISSETQDKANVQAEELPKFNVLKEKTTEEMKKEIESVQMNLRSRQTTKVKNDSKEIKRESSHRIGSMAIKDAETSNEDHLDKKENTQDFDVLNSKAENILKHVKGSAEEHEEQKHKQKDKKQQLRDQEIDREVREIERNILLRLSGESENGDNSHVISLENSDIVKTAKTRANTGQNAEKNVSSKQRLLGKYRSEPARTYVKDQKEKQEKDEFKELEDKLNQIVNKRAEIAELNKQKTVLFDAAHPELKSKLSTQIEAMESIMAEKEERLKELKDRIHILPQSISELNKTLELYKEKQERLDSVFNSTLNQLDEIRNKIQEAKEEYSGEFALVRNQIIEKEKELMKINDIYSSLKDKEDRLINSIQFVKENISRSQEELVNLEDQLERFRSSSKSIEMKIEETSKVLRSLNRQFENYIGKARELDMFDDEIKQIQREYIKAKEKVDLKIDDYRKEILALSKSVELEASNRYLQELERMTSEAEDSFNSLLYDEQEINKSIENKKKELSHLMEEAKALQRSLATKELSNVPKMTPNHVNQQSLSVPIESLADEGSIESDRYILNEQSKDFDVKTLDSISLQNSANKESKLEEIKGTISRFLSEFNKKLGKK